AYRDGERLVRFRPGTPASTAARVNGSIGARTLKSFTIVSNLQLVRLPNGRSVSAALGAYRQRSEVLYAQPNWLYHLAAATERPSGVAKTPDDPMYPQQWAWPKVHAPEAWDITTGSRQVVVTDIDTGLDYNHEDLKANVWHNTA